MVRGVVYYERAISAINENGWEDSHYQRVMFTVLFDAKSCHLDIVLAPSSNELNMVGYGAAEYTALNGAAGLLLSVQRVL